MSKLEELTNWKIDRNFIIFLCVYVVFVAILLWSNIGLIVPSVGLLFFLLEKFFKQPSRNIKKILEEQNQSIKEIREKMMHPKLTTALTEAAYIGNLEVVEALLEAGVDVNKKEEDGCVPLSYAVWMGNIDVIKLLLDNGAIFEDRELGFAAMAGHINIVELLLNRNANINAQDEECQTALIWAIKMNQNDIVQFLLNRGADINIKTKRGNTALIYAVWEGDVSIVKALIAKGANINMKGEGGMTAFMWAKEDNDTDTEIVKLLRGLEISDIPF